MNAREEITAFTNALAWVKVYFDIINMEKLFVLCSSAAYYLITYVYNIHEAYTSPVLYRYIHILMYTVPILVIFFY